MTAVIPLPPTPGAGRTDALLSVRDLVVHFPVGRGIGGSRTVVHAVDGVDLEIRRGETLGLVGESGCGKSTLGRSVVRMVEPTSGEIVFDGEAVGTQNRAARKRFRKRAQFVFQDPVGSLNPRLRVGRIVAEGLEANRMGTRASRRERVREVLEQVGLPADAADRYPHEFSGGQRQRIVIARALAVDPEFVVADEPVSALDVSIQSQVLNLMVDLRERLDLTYLFIAHDLAVVGYISDRIAVMYLGRIVEIGDAATILRDPRHPYTRALLSAAPEPVVTRDRARIVLRGDIPDATHPPSGCRFRTRCPLAQPSCAEIDPVLVPDDGLPDARRVACHVVQPASLAVPPTPRRKV